MTGAAIALLQAGIAIALVKGFTVAFIDAKPPRNLPSQFFPTQPVQPTPTEKPEVVPEKPLPHDSFVDTPKPRLDIPTKSLNDVIVTPVIPSSEPLISGNSLLDVPSVKPSQPTEIFTPGKAKPRGGTAGWVTSSDYPTSDLRAGHMGKVRFQVSIDTSGRATNCTIVESSGYPGLDAATCKNVTRRARFDPATDATGARVPGTYSATIQWVIPKD